MPNAVRPHSGLPFSMTLALALMGASGTSLAQEGAADIGPRLMAEPAVRQALEAVRANEPEMLREQVRLCEIPAPSFHEQARAAVMKKHFEELGLVNIRVDAVGNVLGERPGRSMRPRVVVASHMDTVFPEGTDLKVKQEGLVYKGPGIGDNCRGLVALLGIIKALGQANVQTEGPITFVANIGEEALGNLAGARHLFDVELKDKVDRFVSIDGSGTGFVHVSVGVRRYRVTVTGPGGHSYFRFGAANPIHALGRAVAHIADFEVPETPRTTFSVGRVNGGTSINSIAYEAWMEVDLRSHDEPSLQALDAKLREAVEAGVREENARWKGKGAVSVAWKELGAHQGGVNPAESPMVQATISVTKALGLPIQIFPATTDSNIPMSRGIPAVTIDGGGDGGGGHALTEFFDSTDSWKGTQRALLLVLALTRP
jgi:tripeptide aminopeptidase